MLEILKQELIKRKALSGKLPDIIISLAEAISSKTIPLNMKYTIAVSEMMLYASQFRRNILHWNGTEVPINAISFVVTGSGDGKDSTLNAVRRCFSTGYNMINDRRKELAKQSAIQEAREAGESNPTAWEVYKNYYRAPNPLFVAPSTTEGFIQHLNDLDYDGIGAGFMYTGELGAEITTSSTFIENIKVLAELYDVGNKEVKVLKNRDNQSREIKGLPVSALFQGSPANILYNETVKRRFREEFESKLARRSWFCFTPDKIDEPDFTSEEDAIEAMLLHDEELEDQAIETIQLISKGIDQLTEYHIANLGKPITVDPEVRKLFLIYRRYNSEVSDTIPKLYPMSVLVRKHLQWKALKLAGAIAMFNAEDRITADDYIQAIRFAELLDKDLMRFECELVKEPYELFADYMKTITVNHEAFISLHELRKMNYIPMKGEPTKKIKELVHLVAAYDNTAIYKATTEGVHYQQIVKTDTISISYKEVDNTPIFDGIQNNVSHEELSNRKTKVASTANKDLEVAEVTFEDLGELLKGDYAYSPFVFKDGIRKKDNIIGGTKWVVMDIDDSTITAEECHLMLEDINHHIALSSNPTNEFKFRLLVELDSVVEVDAIIWKHFYLGIAEDLGIKVDPLPQSQIFFSYSTSPVYSNLDASPLDVRNYIMNAIERSEEKPAAEKRLTGPQKEALLADELTTFIRAFDAKPGGRSRELIKAAYYAKDLGLDNDQTIGLMERINDYWDTPMDQDRLERTILSQIRRW